MFVLLYNILFCDVLNKFDLIRFYFLRCSEKYGELMVDVEAGKKENRSLDMKKVSLAKFLDVYKQSEIYLVQDIPPAMKGCLPVIPWI